jgi:hypothetical protein
MRKAFSTRLSSADRGAYGRDVGDPGPTGSGGAWPTTEDKRGRFPERGDCGRVTTVCVLRMYGWPGTNITLDDDDPGRPGSDDRPLE